MFWMGLFFLIFHSYSLPIDSPPCCLLFLAGSGRIPTEGSLEVETVAATRLCPADWLQAHKWPFIQTAGAVTVQQRGVC